MWAGSHGEIAVSEVTTAMKQVLGLPLVVFLGLYSAFAQHQHQKKPITKTLSVAEIHDVARRVSVLIVERKEQGGTRNVGSGVWLAEGFVATCWHVVKDLKGPIKISIGTGDVVVVGGSVIEGAFMDYATTVVASDPNADIAILKTADNPFKSQAVLINTPNQQIKPKMSVARVNENTPVAGTPTVLSGYPLAGLDLVSQTGNVAGTGVVPPNLITGSGNFPKSVRILVSVVSNPGNSGGPVLNDHGELIGIQEGNWRSPMTDEAGRPVVYFRPKMDANGNVQKDANGNPQIEAAEMYQNSGISLVVPTHLITPLLKQAQAGN